MYTGSSCGSTCRVKKVSAMQSAAMSSSFFWRVRGLALVHSIVVRLRSTLLSPGLAVFVGVAGSCMAPLPCCSELLGNLRSFDDRECARPLLSRNAKALVGDFNVLGNASSSIVFPRDREGLHVSVRLRIVMPWRCRSLRFCPSQLQALSPCQLSKHTYGNSHGRSLGGGDSGCPGVCDDEAILRSLSLSSDAFNTRLRLEFTTSHWRMSRFFHNRFGRQSPPRHGRCKGLSWGNGRGAVVLEHAEEQGKAAAARPDPCVQL
jgi:hypothetical protein